MKDPPVVLTHRDRLLLEIDVRDRQLPYMS